MAVAAHNCAALIEHTHSVLLKLITLHASLTTPPSFPPARAPRIAELLRYIPGLELAANTLFSPIFGTFFKTPREGAQTTMHALLADDVPQHAGAYYADCAPLAVSYAHFTDANAAKLWAASMRSTGLAG